MTALLKAIGIVTSDMPESLRFYRTLGLDVPDTPAEGHVNIELPNGFRLMLDSEAEMRSFWPTWSPETGNQVALAFELANADEVDKLYDHVTGAGFVGRKEPWDAFWGQRYAQVSDPNGVPVDLYAVL